MLQAAVLYCRFHDLLSPFDDGLIATEVNICRCQIPEALMITAVVVVLDELPELMLKITRQEVVFQQDAALKGLMPSLDFALCLGMVWRTADMFHALVIEIVC